MKSLNTSLTVVHSKVKGYDVMKTNFLLEQPIINHIHITYSRFFFINANENIIAKGSVVKHKKKLQKSEAKLARLDDDTERYT